VSQIKEEDEGEGEGEDLRAWDSRVRLRESELK
jgi:hypothetical protein